MLPLSLKPTVFEFSRARVLKGGLLTVSLSPFVFLMLLGASAFAQEPDEILRGNILFWGVPVGKGTVQIWHDARYEGMPARRIMASGETSGIFSLFYRVNDRIESFSDPKTTLPYALHVNFEEGRYRRKQQFHFDQERLRIIGAHGSEVIMQEPTWDPLSALFFLRQMPLEQAKTIRGHVSDGRKIYPLEALVVKRDRRKVLREWKDCWMVELKTGSVPLGGIMESQKFRRFTSWFTDDERRTPVHAQGDLFIGSISAELKDVHAKAS